MKKKKKKKINYSDKKLQKTQSGIVQNKTQLLLKVLLARTKFTR